MFQDHYYCYYFYHHYYCFYYFYHYCSIQDHYYCTLAEILSASDRWCKCFSKPGHHILQKSVFKQNRFVLIWSYHSSGYLPDMIPNIIHLSIFQTTSPGTLEQTLFILLASLAGVAFLVVLGLLLCKFQVKIINSIIFIKSSNININVAANLGCQLV